jgi:hypothetical protein
VFAYCALTVYIASAQIFCIGRDAAHATGIAAIEIGIAIDRRPFIEVVAGGIDPP